MDELFLIRLQLLLSQQVSDIQKYRNCFKGSNEFLKAYNEVFKLIKLLQNNPEIKLICHEGKFWTEDEIDKRYLRNKYEII